MILETRVDVHDLKGKAEHWVGTAGRNGGGWTAISHYSLAEAEKVCLLPIRARHQLKGIDR